MGDQLNIKSEEAYALASERSELTGESLTGAVIRALKAQLEQERRTRDRDARIRKVRQQTAEIRQHLGSPLPSSDHGWLYDEDGLPR